MKILVHRLIKLLIKQIMKFNIDKNKRKELQLNINCKELIQENVFLLLGIHMKVQIKYLRWKLKVLIGNIIWMLLKSMNQLYSKTIK